MKYFFFQPISVGSKTTILKHTITTLISYITTFPQCIRRAPIPAVSLSVRLFVFTFLLAKF